MRKLGLRLDGGVPGGNPLGGYDASAAVAAAGFTTPGVLEAACAGQPTSRRWSFMGVPHIEQATFGAASSATSARAARSTCAIHTSSPGNFRRRPGGASFRSCPEASTALPTEMFASQKMVTECQVTVKHLALPGEKPVLGLEGAVGRHEAYLGFDIVRQKTGLRIQVTSQPVFVSIPCG